MSDEWKYALVGFATLALVLTYDLVAWCVVRIRRRRLRKRLLNLSREEYPSPVSDEDLADQTVL